MPQGYPHPDRANPLADTLGARTSQAGIVLLSDQRLGRALRAAPDLRVAARLDPVAAVVVEELAAAGAHRRAVEEAGALFLEALRRPAPRLGLRTVVAVLAATERRPEEPEGALHRLTEGDPLLRLAVDALVRHRPGGAGLRPVGEAREVAALLGMLIYMFRAESEGAALAAAVA